MESAILATTINCHTQLNTGINCSQTCPGFIRLCSGAISCSTVCWEARNIIAAAKAYKNRNLEELTNLSKHQSLAFPYLQEVVKAHVDRFPRDGTKGRPERVIEDITKNISTDFHEVFKEFWNRESIYGFGDSQLKHLYDKVIH